MNNYRFVFALSMVSFFCNAAEKEWNKNNESDEQSKQITVSCPEKDKIFARGYDNKNDTNRYAYLVDIAYSVDQISCLSSEIRRQTILFDLAIWAEKMQPDEQECSIINTRAEYLWKKYYDSQWVVWFIKTFFNDDVRQGLSLSELSCWIKSKIESAEKW